MTQVDISKGIVLDVDFERIMAHPAVVEAAVRFAVKQALTNTHASIAKDSEGAVEKSRALAEKRLEAMYAGSWGQTERGSRIDAVEREMRSLAEAEVKDGLRRLGKKVSKIDPKVIKALVDKQVKAHDARLRKAAEARLAITAEPVEEDDLAELLAGLEAGDESEDE